MQDARPLETLLPDGWHVTQILIGGLSRSMATALEEQLGSVTVHVAETGGRVLEWLAARTCDLLILDHQLPGVDAADVVRRLTERAEAARVPVLYCLDRDAERNGVRARIERFGVRSFLGHPFGARDLAECAAALLSDGSVAVPPIPVLESGPSNPRAGQEEAAAPGSPDDSGIDAFGAVVATSLDVLDGAAVTLLDGSEDARVLGAAHGHARQLAGLLIASGRHDGAALAHEIEHVIDTGACGPAIDALRLSELVVALRTELDRAAGGADPGGPADTRPLLMVIDSGSGFGDNLGLEAQARGLRYRVARDAAEMRALLREEAPAVVLVDLDSAPARRDALATIGEIEATLATTPVLVATTAGSLANRVDIARAGGFGLLRKPVSPAAAVEAAIGAIRRSQVTGCSVLAVDDDAVALADLRSRLEPLGIELTTLHDARRFWEELEGLRPDVVLLGMNTRHHSGLELCRVLRADDRWIALPVIILGDDVDPAAMHLASLAGADDFIPKPLVAGDIVTRLTNRLERQRGVVGIAGTDPLTGVPNRRRAEESLHALLRLALRYRKPFSLAAINVDGLRDVNEACGNAAGDAVLRRLGRLLQSSFRAEDVVGRWGGDQFVFGGFGLEKGDCVRRLRTICDRLGRDPFRGGDAEINVAFSAGVASLFNDGIDLPALQQAAGDTLGFAKTLGRGRVLPAGWTRERDASTEVVDIALVEADDALASLLGHTLEQAGWTLRRFQDATGATGQLCGSLPRLRARVILLEVELPGRDGFSVLRALARDGVLGRTRVIMFTARANETEILKAFDLGATDHVAKPFSVQVLMRRIRRAIQGTS